MNLDKIAHFAEEKHGDLVPDGRVFDPAEQAGHAPRVLRRGPRSR